MAVRYEEPFPGPRGNPLLSFAHDNPTLVASLVAALIFAIRCVAITKGDTYTASILLAYTSLGDAVRALLFFVLPAGLIALTYALAMAAGLSAPFSKLALAPRRFLTGWSGRKPLGLMALSLTAAVLGAYLSGRFALEPGGHVIFDETYYAFVFFMLGSTFAFWGQIRVKMGVSDKVNRVVVFLGVIFFLFVFVLNYHTVAAIRPLFDADTFWLPREHLVFANEKTHVIGYVLNASDNHFVILNDDPRIIIEKKGPPQDRDFCYAKNKGYEEAFKEAGQKQETIIC
jgi:hypothetical protein